VFSGEVLMLTAVLASSLWIASQADRPVPQTAFVTPYEKIADAVATDLVFLGIGGGLDLMSTSRAIKRGCYESNPAGHDSEARTALKMGTLAIRGGLTYVLRRTGRKTMANVARYVGAAADLGFSISNERCGR
jgi:hypothetical protein